MSLLDWLLGVTESTVYCIVDTKGWIQHKRLQYLDDLLPDIDLKVLEQDSFVRRFRWGLIGDEPLYFSSWRMPRHLIESGRLDLTPADLERSMTSVTSHSNIGGGLRPSTAVADGTDPEDAFERAVEILQEFGVVTVNSRILEDLLSPHIDDLIYAPSGVDTDLFHPPDERTYDPEEIRVGWVGKERAAKNHETIREAARILEDEGFDMRLMAVPKGVHTDELRSHEEMRDFYQDLDYYLCASWNEGTPNPCLEAAACGVPLVTTRVGNMPELVEEGDNGFFIEPTVGSIVETFQRLRKLTPDGYERLSRNARASVEPWDYEHRVDPYRQAFERLLRSTGDLE